MIKSMVKSKVSPKSKTASKMKTTKPVGSAATKPTKAKSRKPKKAAPPELIYCSFCHKSAETQKRLIAGPNNIFICDECVEVCVSILFEGDKDFWTTRLIKILTKNNKLPCKVAKISTKKQGIKGYTNA